MIKRAAVALAMSTVVVGPASAWDGFGHMEVAAVAWGQLSTPTKARVGELLRLNPVFDRLSRGAAPGDEDRVAFIRAATWPDMIKGDPDYTSDGPANGNRPPPGPEASQNIGYADKFMHKYWHFVDTPFSTDNTPTTPPEEPNAQTQIAAFRAALPANSGPSDDIRSYDMVWLEHLVGDVHQPLHATTRFSQHHSRGDNGGNSVKITCETRCSARELHAFWDDLLGPNDPPVQAVQDAADQLAPPDPTLGSIADETVWIRESFDAARAKVYVSPPLDVGNEPFMLTDDYAQHAVQLAKERVALAGARLANLLNAAFQ